MVSRLKALPHPSCGHNLCNLTLRDEPVVNTGQDRTERDNTPTGSTPRGISGRRLCERFFENCVPRLLAGKAGKGGKAGETGRGLRRGSYQLDQLHQFDQFHHCASWVIISASWTGGRSP